MILLHDTTTDVWRVAVSGVGVAAINSPDHWRQVIAKGRNTGVYESPYIADLLEKIEAQS